MSSSDPRIETEGTTDRPPARVLRWANQVAVEGVRGCVGATAGRWRGDQLIEAVATHPDLETLLRQQSRSADGPLWEALRRNALVLVDDYATDHRWPEVATRALCAGLRAYLVLPFDVGDTTLTLELYAVRPHALVPAAVTPIATVLADEVRTAFAQGEQ